MTEKEMLLRKQNDLIQRTMEIEHRIEELEKKGKNNPINKMKINILREQATQYTLEANEIIGLLDILYPSEEQQIK